MNLYQSTLRSLLKIIRRFRNLIYWFPVIWRDEHWDQDFLYRIMRHKIAAMLAHTLSCKMGRQDDVPERMEAAVSILDNLIGDVYHQKMFAEHAAIYGDSVWEEIPLEDQSGFFELEIRYPDAESQEVALDQLIAMGRLADQHKSLALHSLGELIKDSDRWWD